MWVSPHVLIGQAAPTPCADWLVTPCPTLIGQASPLPHADWPGPPPPFFFLPSIEIDQKLQEIMKQTGYLTVGGQVSTEGGRGTHRGDPAPPPPPPHVCVHFQPPPPPQRYQAEINDLENLGEIGSGTCGQVWKMRFRKTGHVIAVKVRTTPTPLKYRGPSPPRPTVRLGSGPEIHLPPPHLIFFCPLPSKCGARETGRRTNGS